MPSRSEAPQIDGSMPVHLFAFNPNPKVLSWERLEYMRLQKLGLGNRYSRHFNVTRTSANMRVPTPTAVERERTAAVSGPRGSRFVKEKSSTSRQTSINNSVAPFATLEKPTCGYFFSDRTDNRKKNFGIPPSDLVKWRTAQFAS